MSTQRATIQEIAEWILHAALRIALFAILWFGLTEGEAASWIVGGPAVLVAIAMSFWLRPRTELRWRLTGAIRFVGFFLIRSLVAGADVAHRAIAPGSLRLTPGFCAYPMRLPPGTPRMLFASTTSLLPGTLTAKFHSDRLLVHALDVDGPFENQLRSLESAVAALYGLDITP